MLETVGLEFLRRVQAYIAVCQHILFHHIGQFVSSVLIGFGEMVHSSGQKAHDKGHCRKNSRHNQCQFPIEKEQVANQGQ